MVIFLQNRWTVVMAEQIIDSLVLLEFFIQINLLTSSITAYTNHITNRVMNLKFMNHPKGTYAIKLLSSLSQKLLKKVAYKLAYSYIS